MAPVSTSTTRPFRDALGPRIVLGERPILPAGSPRVGLVALGRRFAFESVEALDDISEEARLALLAVRDHVDACLGLLPDRVRHGVTGQAGERVAIVRLGAFLRAEE